MLQLTAPNQLSVQVAESSLEGDDRFPSAAAEAFAAFYADQGYVVVRGLVPADTCDAVINRFDSCVRPSNVAILRQKDMRYERHRHDANGLLGNPIFNIQDLQTKGHGPFRQAALDVLTDRAIRQVLDHLLDKTSTQDVRLVQSMFFEAPANTWPHQDSYYQDSARRLGGAAAAWIALETIHPNAGRFFIAPESHRCFPLIRNGGTENFGTGHVRYKEKMSLQASALKLVWRAPYLEKGDVLFWNSLTAHGSLGASGGQPYSRRSMTSHYLRADDSLLQFHSRIRRQKIRLHNGMQVGLLHDQDDWRNRMVRFSASTFPRAWDLARRQAIRLLVSQ